MTQRIINSVPSPHTTVLQNIHQYLSSLAFSPPNPIRLFKPLFLLTNTISPPSPTPFHRAEQSFRILQQWYNSTTGLYTTTGWWNSANLLTTLSNLAQISDELFPEIPSILENSFQQAPSQTFQHNILKSVNVEIFLIKTTLTDQNPHSSHLRVDNKKPSSGNGFLNNYYDDEGWWALAWIQAYDLTSTPKYLHTAIEIFADMQLAENTTPCNGGIWWDKSHTYVNAIANELYLSVAAHLANRVGVEEKMGCYRVAKRQWEWFERSGMVNEEGTVNDGLEIVGEGVCRGNNGTVWSYNQGVVVGGLVELWGASVDVRYLDEAVRIAEAAIKELAGGETGILKDVCEDSGCGADGVQFKGVFLRGVLKLLGAMKAGEERSRLEKFAEVNAESIWENDRNEKGELGVAWSGPVREVNAGSHGSALDALVTRFFVEGIR